MNEQQFLADIDRKAKLIASYANSRFPAEAGNTALRFINGNFRAQGWQGKSFQQWSKSDKLKGSTLIKKGHLRAASYYVTTGAGSVTLRNTMPYAKAHNEGSYINAVQNVGAYTRKAHTRMQGGKLVKVRQSVVNSHTRRLSFKMPRRQFFPTATSPSPVLNNAITRNIKREFKQIFNNN
ncbi:MAG: hypothetical protein PHZ24_09040 [Bacteroidales bacterium]|nr:hypothetical protein [Bacteroidales bacterium]